jgi:hypothetical protein
LLQLFCHICGLGKYNKQTARKWEPVVVIYNNDLYDGKGKFALEQAMKAQRGSRAIALFFL